MTLSQRYARFAKTVAEAPPLLIAFGIALVVFSIALDLHTMNPLSTDWCLEWDSDLRVYFLGFSYFRHAPWGFPLTSFDSVFYPVGTSIVNMDSIPLVAVPLKLFDGILPEPFQYFGPWLFACVWLQAYFGFRVANHLAVSRAVAWAASFVVAFAPAFVGRFGHAPLSAHWLILASLGAAVGALPRYALWLLPTIACWVHPYLLAMTFVICAAGQWRFHGEPRAIVRAGASALGVAVSLFLLGYGSMRGTRAPGYEEYVADLLTFFNPNGLSSLIRMRGSDEVHVEGAAYLGIGGIVLSFLLAFSLRRSETRESLARNWVLLAVCVAMALYAVTAAPKLLGKPLFRIAWLSDFLEPLGSRFRATGRFIWPLYYCIFIFGFRAFDRLVNRRGVAALAALSLALVQAVDLGPWLFKQGRNPDLVRPAELGPVPEDIERAVARGAKLLLFVPPVKTRCGGGRWQSDWFPYAMLGARAKLKTNANFRQARITPEDEEIVCKFTFDVLSHLERHPGTVVVRDQLPLGR